MTIHSEHGASITARWTNCHGSVLMSRGLPNKASPAAEEGTDAHLLAEWCLRTHQDAEEYTGRMVEGFVRPDRLTPAEPVTAEMAEAVQIYLDECRSVLARPGFVKIEAAVSLASLNPPVPMFGTADYLAYIPETETLRVRDLKYGRGHNVEAIGNLQLMYYALGAMLYIPHDWGVIRHIDAGIVQPRRRNPVRNVVLDPIELTEWSIPLFEHAAATLAPEAPLTAGEWCKFCPARGQCPAQAALAMETARMEFADDLPPEDAVPGAVASTAVQRVDQEDTRLIQVGDRRLTPDQLSGLLHRIGQARQALHDIEEAGRAAIRDGGLPGWKEVPTRPTTRWRDPAMAEGMLVMDIGLDEAAIYQPRELLSPAGARGVLRDKLHAERLEAWTALPGAPRSKGKKPTKKDAEADARDALASLTFSSSSGTNLVPDEDDRPAIESAADEFADDLPAITDETVNQD